MKSNLPFDFVVDLDAKSVVVTRVFDAGQDLVWDAFSKAELLDQWWAPKPFASKTKDMNFEVGGRRFYAMVSPEGHAHWAMHQYTHINPKSNFKMLNAFADEAGNPNLPGSDWDLTFKENNGKTTVNITILNDSRERMEMMLEMGFREGFTATLDALSSLFTEGVFQ